MGGAEKVIQQIAEYMDEKGWEVFILGKSIKSALVHNFVKIQNCGSTPSEFFHKLSVIKPDHLLVYSDYFVFWTHILDRVESLDYKVTLIPVGMNAMLARPELLYKLRSNKDKISVVTHSDNYQDYSTCKSLKIPVTVIPNGINLHELRKRDFSFKERYNIKTEKMLLCVSNFFPGKGQEYLLPMLNNFDSELKKDFTMVFICTTVNFAIANMLMGRTKAQLLNCSFNSKMLVDIPRWDVVQAFHEADIFLFPSQKEVAPLVILEAMASKTPWVSLDVGSIPTLAGGTVITGAPCDREDNKMFNKRIREEFSQEIEKLLLDGDRRKCQADAGYKVIMNELNWDIIGEKYYKFFEGE